MINTSNYIFNPSKPTITKECFDWCLEQNFINQNNLTIEGITIVIIALVMLFLYFIFISFEVFIDYEKYDKDKIYYYASKLPELALYLLIGFMVWFLYFT